MQAARDRLFLFDPSIIDQSGRPSLNLGNDIIRQSVLTELSVLFKGYEVICASTHAPPTRAQIASLQTCRYVFVSGSNLLGNRVFSLRKMRWRSQWELPLRLAKQVKRAVLVGAGWARYEGEPDKHIRAVLQAALSKEWLHSVRDEYAKRKLESVGMTNVLNTGCPTLWPLGWVRREDFPASKADQALVMLTDYREDPSADVRLISLLSKHYKQIFMWPQGTRDEAYARRLRLPVIMLDRSLTALDSFLARQEACDYVGTRLHGGICVLRAKKRALILKVDNRATEMARDTGLPTVARDDIEGIEAWIQNPVQPCIRLNVDAIERWRSQFAVHQCDVK